MLISVVQDSDFTTDSRMSACTLARSVVAEPDPHTFRFGATGPDRFGTYRTVQSPYLKMMAVDPSGKRGVRPESKGNNGHRKLQVRMLSLVLGCQVPGTDHWMEVTFLDFAIVWMLGWTVFEPYWHSYTYLYTLPQLDTEEKNMSSPAPVSDHHHHYHSH